jgi:hypothetical protein
MQKYRADSFRTQPDGAVCWYADWAGGPTLARINKCRIAGTDLRRAVYITGAADTWFSIPAATRIRGRYVRGYVTGESDTGDNLVFHALDSHKLLLA